jgi:signal transduction histidine kinase
LSFLVAVANLLGAAIQRQQAVEAVHRMNASLEERVTKRTRQVRNLAARLTMVEQEERRRLAGILHDDLQQQLYGLGLTLGLLEDADTEETARLRKQAAEIVDDATRLTHSLVTELSPPILSSENLSEILLWLAAHKKDRYNLDVDLKIEDLCDIPDRSLRVLVLQVLRELLFNVVKHAQTLKATVHCWHENGNLMLRVEDEGAGFDPHKLDESAFGNGAFGLFNVRERVENAGGRLVVGSTPGTGTRVSISLPLTVSRPEHRSRTFGGTR